MNVSELLEVTLPKEKNFLLVRETLTRIGIASRESEPGSPRKLYQSCHILHKRGRYYIVHFKEMFALDGKDTTLSENDVARRNSIALLLEEWGLVDIVDKNAASSVLENMNEIRIIRFADRESWVLVPKYAIGVKKDESGQVDGEVSGRGGQPGRVV